MAFACWHCALDGTCLVITGGKSVATSVHAGFRTLNPGPLTLCAINGIAREPIVYTVVLHAMMHLQLHVYQVKFREREILNDMLSSTQHHIRV